jgi:hypothetical protein
MAIAIAVVLVAALISWKFFYHDPHAQLSKLTSEVEQANAVTAPAPAGPKMFTADSQTLAAVRRASRPLGASALRRQVTAVAEDSGLKISSIVSSGLVMGGVVRPGATVRIKASGQSASIIKFLTGVQGSLHLEGHQIRGDGPRLSVGDYTMSGKTPSFETVQLEVSSGT